ncbi:DAK2 domain-containing protein [Cellulosimicrobium sp. Marseille-Q4280]|uniref:DAK2 domain-containing protein n=1 Tax=Cellulosimicrobium sp. Marseille-Q4280 TaxID=2937992 RepID=UPI002040F250|nr:DAK2 domain-containing protein [Cellulosimicrobium sp. Marseille-Q4280]
MSRRTDVMDAADVLAWARDGVEALGAARSALDRVNVVPVADADTGTNLYLTFLDATRSLGTSVASAPSGEAHGGNLAEAHAGDLLVRLARGALVGARGNSGVILSEYLRGLAVALAPHRTVTGTALAAALAAAARTARGAVAEPLPGTILTAADDAARAAAHAATPWAAHAADARAGSVRVAGPAVVAGAAHDGARAAALRSSTELDVLARARVLDAGALGLTLLLGALRVVLGRAASPPPKDARARSDRGPRTVEGPVRDVVSEVLDMMSGTAPVRGADDGLGAEGAASSEGGELEVMFVVEATRPVLSSPDARTGPVDVAGRLRAALGGIGDSVVVVGGRTVGGPGQGPDLGPDGVGRPGGLWQAHVHTDDPVAAVTAGRAALLAFPPGGASLRQVRVRHLVGTGHEAASRSALDPASGEGALARGESVPDDGAPGDAGTARGGRVGLVAVTTAPGLVADLARAGAVVLLRDPGSEIDAAALHRVVVDTGASHVAVLPGTDLGGDLVAATRAAVRADGVERLEVLDAPSDLHVVVALAAAQLVDHGATGDGDGTGLDAARRATVSVRVAVVETSGGTSEDDLPAALDDGLGEVLAGPTEILTVLADDDVAQAVLDALVGRASAGGAETVVLRSGRAGGTVTLGAEPPGGVGHDEGGVTG